MFTGVLALCAKTGLAGVGVIAIDSTKMGSSAALSANKASEQIDPMVEKPMAEAESLDAAEDAQYGEGV